MAQFHQRDGRQRMIQGTGNRQGSLQGRGRSIPIARRCLSDSQNDPVPGTGNRPAATRRGRQLVNELTCKRVVLAGGALDHTASMGREGNTAHHLGHIDRPEPGGVNHTAAAERLIIAHVPQQHVHRIR